MLADGGYTAHGLYFQGSQPSYAVIDQEMTIRDLGTSATISESTLETWIKKLR